MTSLLALVTGYDWLASSNIARSYCGITTSVQQPKSSAFLSPLLVSTPQQATGYSRWIFIKDKD